MKMKEKRFRVSITYVVRTWDGTVPTVEEEKKVWEDEMRTIFENNGDAEFLIVSLKELK